MKNAILGWLYSSPATLLAIDTQTAISIISAIVLPILFFAVGKTVDVLVQLYRVRKQGKKDEADQ